MLGRRTHHLAGLPLLPGGTAGAALRATRSAGPRSGAFAIAVREDVPGPIATAREGTVRFTLGDAAAFGRRERRPQPGRRCEPGGSR